MPAPDLHDALSDFRDAQETHRRNLRDPAAGEALRDARGRLDDAIAAALGRLPYRTRRVPGLPRRRDAPVHLAPVESVAIDGRGWAAGTALCEAPAAGYASAEHVPCHACLAVVERHAGRELDPPTLELF